MNPPSIAPARVAGHSAYRLAAGALEAHFLPALGMLCSSLTRDGEEMLGRTSELDSYIRQGSAIAIPLLYPWANRLAGFHYAAAGRAVDLEPGAPTLHFDGRGLPMHGVPGAKLSWSVHASRVDETLATLSAQLKWDTQARLAVFPYPHSVEMTVALDAHGLEVTTAVRASAGAAVPVSFGFHPYFRLAGVPRREWILELPPLRRLALDAQQIPTGEEEDFTWGRRALGAVAFDDPFRLVGETARFVVTGGGHGIAVELGQGYPFAQIYAPAERDFIALEPMTAPGNALVSGLDLVVVEPNATFTAAFRVVPT